MPLLDHRQLEGREERILAYVILTFISHGYVWQDRPHNVAKVYPIILLAFLQIISKCILDN